jgi:uncharacterized protein (DUF433 family)
MDREFIERRENGLYIAGSRVAIDRIVWEYQRGEDPETIQSHYPTLTPQQVNGAIAFYLSHRDEVDQLIEEHRLSEDSYTAAHPAPADIRKKFERMRRQMALRRS